MGNRLLVSFVFCTNTDRHARAFAHSLQALLTHLHGGDCELVVVAPEPDSVLHAFAGLEKDLPIRLVKTVWGSRGTSRNQGFSSARGDWVYFIDQDVRFDVQNLPSICRSIQRLNSLSQDIHLATGPYLSMNQCSYWGVCYNWLTNLWLRNSAGGIRVLGGNLIVRKAALGQAPFSDRFRDGGEEMELCERVRLRGGRSKYDPDLALSHEAEHSLILFCRRMRAHAKAKRILPRATTRTQFNWPMVKEMCRFPLGIGGVLVFVLVRILERVTSPG